MADQLQLRGGTTSEHSTFTGALREVTVDTDKDTVVVHDNSTAGGHPLLREDLSNLPAGTIDNADINANAEIAVSKLADGAARQLLQTDSAGTGVEWTSNVDVPGTLDVTGAATLDSTLDVTGLISADGKVSFPLGTAALPSLYPGTDTNTGIYSPGADQLAVATNGTGRLFVSSSGKIGINTASPSSQFSVGSDTSAPSVISLDYNPTNSTAASISANHSTGQVSYNAASSYFPVFYSNNTERLRITSAGLVGIGTSSPGYPLDVKTYSSGPSQTGAVRFGAGGDNTSTRIVQKTTAGGIPYSEIAGPKDGNGWLAFTTGSSDTERLRITSGGNVGIGTTTVDEHLHIEGIGTQRVKIEATDTSIAGLVMLNTNRRYDVQVNGSDLQIYDNTGSAERLRLDSSGRLLVGTSTAPTATQVTDARLVVEGNAGGNPTGGAILTLARGSAITTSGQFAGEILFADTGAGYYGRIASECDGTPGTDDYPGRLVFSVTADGTSSPVERMRLQANGILAVPTAYTNTTASAANVFVDSNGKFSRSTSSIKYKTNVETLENIYADALLSCRPVWYRSTCESDNPSHGWWGFIAEEVAEIDPRLVHWKTTEISHDENGSIVETPCDPEPEGVQYDRFVPHLLNLIKRQGEAIADLQAEVAALKAQ